MNELNRAIGRVRDHGPFFCDQFNGVVVVFRYPMRRNKGIDNGNIDLLILNGFDNGIDHRDDDSGSVARLLGDNDGHFPPNVDKQASNLIGSQSVV